MRPSFLLPLVVAIALVGPMTAPAFADTPNGLDPPDVDTFVTDYLDRHGLPGATVAVVKDGEIVHEAGYGEDSEGGALTEHSRLRVESVSKSFTAFAVLQLVDEGEVNLDAPVTDYLPDFGLSDDITVRQLLSHTSGIPSPTIVGPAESLEEMVDQIRHWDLNAKPGTSYSYSNFNYVTAALLVQEVSGQSFSDYLAANVFAPTGMDDTVNVTTSSEEVDGLVDGYAAAYGMAAPASSPEQMRSGAGGVVSTAHDMAAWLAMQQRGGETADGQRLLSEDLVAESHTAQPNADRAGLGWRRSSPNVKPERVSHSGASVGFNAQQDLVPDSGYGVVVLVNSHSTIEHAYEISSGVIDLTEGKTPEPGLPVATVIDAVLGALTVASLVLGVLGLRRARRWVTRRASWSAWRFGPRLLPQLLAPTLAVFLFLVVPALQNNSFTPIDVFWLLPAFSVLLLTLTLVGAVLTVARVTVRVRSDVPAPRAG